MPDGADTHVRIAPDTAEVDLLSVFDRFDAVFEAAPFKHEVTVAGCRVTAACHTEDYARMTARALAASGRTDSQCRIVVAPQGTPGLPRPVWAQAFYQERQVEAQIRNSRFRLHHFPDCGFWQMFDRDTGRGIQVLGGPHGYPEWEPGSPLRNFLHWHFVTQGRGLAHAGTLGVDGTGVMLAGEGGSGKSGTVLAGIAQGLGSVGDDYVLVETDAAGVTARPLFLTLKQDPEGLDRLGLSVDDLGAAPLNWQGKHQFSIADMAPGQPEPSLKIGAMLLPRITGGERTTFDPATAKDAFLSLCPTGVSQIPGDRDTNFAFCARLTRRLPAYRANLGTDPTEIAAAIRTFIKELPE